MPSARPYARGLERQVTIRLEESTIDHFKELAAKTEIPCQILINPYLHDCAAMHEPPLGDR